MNSSEIKPFKVTGIHSFHRRSFAHNYYAPFIYHIILKKNKKVKSFGLVVGDARIPPGNAGCASMQESDLGKIIAKSILHLPYQYPIIKILQFCVMPDHVHILLQVVFWSDRHLDFYIEALKSIISEKYLKKEELLKEDSEIFEKGYCDKPLYDNRSLDGLFRYIRENPHRLAMRQQFPQFFQRVRKLRVGEFEYDAYGNLFLFRNPDKATVKISRTFTPEECNKKTEEWLSAAKEGTVLVSPFISHKEKGIRKMAESNGASIILITPEAFPERFKPAAHDFELCSKGRLLIISMGVQSKTSLSLSVCLQMNSLANLICTQD